jgi:hypothetical protein
LHELTIGNLRRRNVDLVSGACIGLAACTRTALSTRLATIVDPFVGNVLFADLTRLHRGADGRQGAPARRSR